MDLLCAQESESEAVPSYFVRKVPVRISKGSNPCATPTDSVCRWCFPRPRPAALPHPTELVTRGEEVAEGGGKSTEDWGWKAFGGLRSVMRAVLSQTLRQRLPVLYSATCPPPNSLRLPKQRAPPEVARGPPSQRKVKVKALMDHLGSPPRWGERCGFGPFEAVKLLWPPGSEVSSSSSWVTCRSHSDHLRGGAPSRGLAEVSACGVNGVRPGVVGEVGVDGESVGGCLTGMSQQQHKLCKSLTHTAQLSEAASRGQTQVLVVRI